MTALAPYVRILGRGPGRARNLTLDEARHAMEVIIRGEAAQEAVGALLMLMRYRGETAGEIAGFTTAFRSSLPKDVPAAQLDWPTYAAGRTRGLPWFLLAARLVAMTGTKVLMHGWNSHQASHADVRSALAFAGIENASSIGAARVALSQNGIAYVPLETLSPQLHDLLKLRDILGLRSCLNTVARMLNPSQAELCVQGVFHPSYRELQRDAAALLGQGSTLTIKGGGGEFERHPGKAIEVIGHRAGIAVQKTAPAIVQTSGRLAEGCLLPNAPESLRALWCGDASDPFSEACVTGTAALVLFGAGRAKTIDGALCLAKALWSDRTKISIGKAVA